MSGPLDRIAIALFLVLLVTVVGLVRHRNRVLRGWQDSREALSVEEFASRYFGKSQQAVWAASTTRRFIEAQLERELPFLQPDDDLINDLVLTEWPHISFAADLSASVGVLVQANEINRVRTVSDLVALLAAKCPSAPEVIHSRA